VQPLGKHENVDGYKSESQASKGETGKKTPRVLAKSSRKNSVGSVCGGRTGGVEGHVSGMGGASVLVN